MTVTPGITTTVAPVTTDAPVFLGLDVVISKEDIAGKEIAHAELTLRSVDNYDLSSVVVTQDGVSVSFKLSGDHTAISFETVDYAVTKVSGLSAGNYELTETVTPKAYLTAAAIYFELKTDGTVEHNGTIIVKGAPIIMVDKADPSYEESNERTPIPATGEQISVTTIAGIIVLLSLCFVGLVIYKKEI